MWPTDFGRGAAVFQRRLPPATVIPIPLWGRRIPALPCQARAGPQLTGGPSVRCGRLAAVGKYEELRLRILEGKSDANIHFDDLRRLLEGLGFEERIRGSHHIFRKHGVWEMINLQQEGTRPRCVRYVRCARSSCAMGWKPRRGNHAQIRGHHLLEQ